MPFLLFTFFRLPLCKFCELSTSFFIYFYSTYKIAYYYNSTIMTDFDLSVYPAEEFVSFKRCNSPDGIKQIGQNDYVPLAKRPTTEVELRDHNQESSSFLPIQDYFSEEASCRANIMNGARRSSSFISDSLVCSGSLAQQRSNCSPTTLAEDVPSFRPHSPLSVQTCPHSNISGSNVIPTYKASNFFTDSNSNRTKFCDFDKDEEAMSSQLFKDLPTSLAEFEMNLDREKRHSPPSLRYGDSLRSPVESCPSILSRSPSTYLPVSEDDEEEPPNAEDLEVAMITESFENQMKNSQSFSTDAQENSPVLSDYDPYGIGHSTQDRSHFTPNSVFSDRDIVTPSDSIWRTSTEQSGDLSFDIEDMVLTSANSALSVATKSSALEPFSSPLSFDTFLSNPRKSSSEFASVVSAADEQLSNATEALAHNVVESLFDNSSAHLEDFPPATTFKSPQADAPVSIEMLATSEAGSRKLKEDQSEQMVPEEMVDSWEDLDSEDYCPELADAMNKVSIKNPTTSQTAQSGLAGSSKAYSSDLDHVLEAYQLTPRIKTEAIETALEEARCDARVLRVDDNHALLIFSSSHHAFSATTKKRLAVFKLRPLAEASQPTLTKVHQSRSQLAPTRFRPQTNASVARRLIENSLGKRSTISAEKRHKEREQLKAARDLKKLIAGIWDE
ncbi:hypothetical protein L596_003435 [Steinernema carpocapsae]|uniref:Uncharacterized protein n=1 Tax=Steinernema carpocapsae TaxID=34508 RepID=A0A4V6I7Z4_STECR|nr:hypothetical protein L596_003435 [Steinernema carpocapsae]